MDLQVIKNKIFEVRGCRVMMDFHLAELYGVPTKVLKQAVKRNIQRFPPDFRFTLSKEEWDGLVTNCDQLPENSTDLQYNELYKVLTELLNKDDDWKNRRLIGYPTSYNNGD